MLWYFWSTLIIKSYKAKACCKFLRMRPRSTQHYSPAPRLGKHVKNRSCCTTRAKHHKEPFGIASPGIHTTIPYPLHRFLRYIPKHIANTRWIGIIPHESLWTSYHQIHAAKPHGSRGDLCELTLQLCLEWRGNIEEIEL